MAEPEISFTTNDPNVMREFLNAMQRYAKERNGRKSLTERVDSNNVGNVEFEEMNNHKSLAEHGNAVS